jgi:hypothetical protein
MSTIATSTPRFIIMTRRPALQGKAREFGAGYRKIALVEVDPEILAELGQTEPAMISERSKGVVSIIDCDSLYYGEGKTSEGARYLAHLQRQAEELNATATNHRTRATR